MFKNRKMLIGGGIVAVLAAGGAFVALRPSKQTIKWRTAKVDRGNVVSRISATGTLNALVQVPVGTQVSGVVVGLYADFNSLVKKGQVIAKIDDTPWQAQLKDAEAQVERAKATLQNAEADFKRNQRLAQEHLISQADLDARDLSLKTARASLESAKATLARARLNLGYCTLTAPVDGVVVARLVDEGQTVAASFNTPNVFNIARSLDRMKVQAAIDEADIGQVRMGQRAFFTVDSYPDKQFQGVVSEVQLNPVIANNVVTYNVVMHVSNEPREGRGGDAAAAGPKEGRPEGPRRPRPEGRPADASGEGHRRPWGEGRRPEGAGEGARRPWGGEGKAGRPGQSGADEVTTARYIPAGSPVYKGDLALFPGMTANCTIITDRRSEVLRVPSVALRFNPAAFQKGKEDKPAAPAQGPGQGAAPGGGRQGGQRGMVAKREDRIWVLENGQPKAIPVKAGLSDGSFTEISGEGIQEGLVILTGVESNKPVAGGAAPIGVPGAPGGGGQRR